MFVRHAHGRYIILLSMLVFVTACSGLKTYPDMPDKNLHVTTRTDSSTDAAIDIYRVEPDCNIKYSGTVRLNKPEVDIGITPGRSSYLVFTFTSSGLFSGSSIASYSTLLRPRTGDDRFDIDVSYIENIYNVVIHERRKNSKQGREIEARSLDSCRPL